MVGEFGGYDALSFARLAQQQSHLQQALSERFPGQVPYMNSFVDRQGTRWSVGYDERGIKCWIPELPEGPW